MLKIVYTVTLVIALIVATPLAYATNENESSYKYGYKEAQVEWDNCTAPDDGCGTVTTDCFSPTTDKTACVDGFVDGWNHVCDPVKAKENVIPCPTTFQQEVTRVGY
jgi:hypothetical protein